jgi:hypothetical protein
MLRTFAVMLLAIVMSVGLAQARGHRFAPRPPLSQCETERATTATCVCGPAKVLCPKGMFCHAFINVCRP